MADVTVPWEYIDNFSRSIHDLDGVSQSLLADALANTDLSDRTAVTALMRSVCRTGNEAATQLSTQFYRGMSLMQTGADMTRRVTSGYDETATDVAVSAIMRDSEGDPDKLARMLGDRLSYEINRASKRGVYRAGRADGRDVRYARVPVGAETCAWCLMTAGLGYWYMTEEAASHSHAHCDCVVVPSIGRGDVVLNGYDSSVFRDMWRKANEMRMNGDIPPEIADRIAREKAAKGKGYREDTNGTLSVMRWLYNLH